MTLVAAYEHPRGIAPGFQQFSASMISGVRRSVDLFINTTINHYEPPIFSLAVVPINIINHQDHPLKNLVKPKCYTGFCWQERAPAGGLTYIVPVNSAITLRSRSSLYFRIPEVIHLLVIMSGRSW